MREATENPTRATVTYDPLDLLTETERRMVENARESWRDRPGRPVALLAIIDRLAPQP